MLYLVAVLLLGYYTASNGLVCVDQGPALGVFKSHLGYPGWAALPLETDSWRQECGVALPQKAMWTYSHNYRHLPIWCCSQLWYYTSTCQARLLFCFCRFSSFIQIAPFSPSYGVHGAMSADWARKEAADTGGITNAGGGVCTRNKGCSVRVFEACTSSISVQLPWPYFVDVVSYNAAYYLY